MNSRGSKDSKTAFTSSACFFKGVKIRFFSPIRLELKFGEALTGAAHVLVYGESDSLIEITKGREVVTDYTA